MKLQIFNQTAFLPAIKALFNGLKEKVIEQLHAKWSHPDNEVHNRIKQFAIKSPENLKPILES